MGSTRDLAKRLKELEEKISVCVRCGMCQSVCPLFDQTGKEADVARGKIALLNGLMENLFKDPAGVRQRLNRCLLCGTCADYCPSNVNALEIFITARGILSDFQALSRAKKILLKNMLANPRLFNRLTQWAAKFQHLMVKSRENPQGTSCARIMSPLLKDRHIIPLSDKPFHATAEEIRPDQPPSGIKVLFFTGCLIDKLMPHIAHDLVKVLSHHKIDVIIPENQGCCGIPALAAGDRQTFDRLVAHHLALFELTRYDYLVTACATCTATIRKLWPALYRHENVTMKTAVNDLAGKTMDINQFLVEAAGLESGGPLKGLDPVTYHDPCHLKKSLNVTSAPRQVIAAAGYPLMEMKDADKCCGMGGSFNLSHYDLSSRIGAIKAENILNTGCSTIATGCPACIVQISDMLSKAGSDIRVTHPIALYARSIEQNQAD